MQQRHEDYEYGQYIDTEKIMLRMRLEDEADRKRILAGIPKQKKIKQLTPRPTIKRFNTMGRGRR